MRKILALLVLLLVPVFVFAAGTGPPSSSSSVCKNVNLSCSAAPCFPLGVNGFDFSGNNNQYWININVTSGSLNIDVEGTTPGGVMGLISTFTTGFNGYPVVTPPVIRVVNNGTGVVGNMVICGNN